MFTWIILMVFYHLVGIGFTNDVTVSTAECIETKPKTTRTIQVSKLQTAMDKNQKLLVLDEEYSPGNRGLEFRIHKNKVKEAILASGAKIRHDSGGRFIVVHVSDKSEKALLKLLPKARILPIDSDLKELISDMDANEKLFFDALRTRASKKYRDAKMKRKPGESPEEKELFSGSCVRDEY